MHTIAGVIVAAVLLSTEGGTNAPGADAFFASPSSSDYQSTFDQQPPIDITALLTQARGAPHLICSLASHAIAGYGWGNWSRGPMTPLDDAADDDDFDFERGSLPAADVNRLLEALATDDACVREISVQILGRQRGDLVVNGLLTRLGAPDPALREVAALGLGLVPSPKSVDPLIRALRDASPGVRANSAWALGRLENGKALSSIQNLFRDDADKVREAAVIAAGKMDSTSSVLCICSSRGCMGARSARVSRVHRCTHRRTHAGQRCARSRNGRLGTRSTRRTQRISGSCKRCPSRFRRQGSRDCSVGARTA